MKQGRWRWVAGVLVLLAAAYAAYWAYRFVRSRLGPLTPLVLGVVLIIVLAVLLTWAWHRWSDAILAAATRAGSWVWTRVRATRAWQRAHERFPGVWRFLGARLDPRATAGLGLSIAVVIAAAALWAFLEILFEVVSGSSVTAVDHRVIELFETLRTSGGDRVMLTASYIGSGRSVGVLAAAAVLIALVLRRWRDAALVVGSLVAGSAFFAAIKLLVRRPRPALEEARVVQGGFSFPSGHATMAAVFYLTIAFVLVRAARRGWLRVAIAIAAIAMVLWIGISRVYLGVHYPSDIAAGAALGVAAGRA